MKSKHVPLFPPLIYNVFKPARMSSYDVVRHFKRNLPQGFGKIGHFGTLDPFACGVLMIGTGGAARLNDYIHDGLPKTYLAVGKLGLETPTGDYTSEVVQTDTSRYLSTEIARFPRTFIQERIRLRFLGNYLQAPHKYSAAKFMGKNLHEWAREGVEVKKEPVLRKIHSLEVVKYAFPYLTFRATVSSGTYIRTLFADICQDLGTIGTLIALVRESVGKVTATEALKKSQWPQDRDESVILRAMQINQVLSFPEIVLDETEAKSFRNGAFLKRSGLSHREYWLLNEKGEILGLAENVQNLELRPKINFHSIAQA